MREVHSDLSSVPRLGKKLDGSADHFDALSHSGQAQAVAGDHRLERRFQIKADAVVANIQQHGLGT